MRLTLPYPPLANRYWRVWRGRAVKSPAARDYQSSVRLANRRKPIEGPVSVSVSVYRPWRRGDLDGALKVLLDALQGVAYADDSQVVRLHAERFEDKANPRVEVVVEPVRG